MHFCKEFNISAGRASQIVARGIEEAKTRAKAYALHSELRVDDYEQRPRPLFSGVVSISNNKYYRDAADCLINEIDSLGPLEREKCLAAFENVKIGTVESLKAAILLFSELAESSDHFQKELHEISLSLGEVASKYMLDDLAESLKGHVIKNGLDSVNSFDQLCYAYKTNYAYAFRPFVYAHSIDPEKSEAAAEEMVEYIDRLDDRKSVIKSVFLYTMAAELADTLGLEAKSKQLMDRVEMAVDYRLAF
ncbi:MAG: hypothetical protein KGH62_01375 [Candidatus Micrarchaeota archaeon]|nr:hypothetical protein [Candidatus Micrarchaeota archaeon]